MKVVLTILMLVSILSAELFDDINLTLGMSLNEVKEIYPNLTVLKTNVYVAKTGKDWNGIAVNYFAFHFKSNKVTSITLSTESDKMEVFMKAYDIMTEKLGTPALNKATGPAWQDTNTRIYLLPGKQTIFISIEEKSD